MAGAPDAASQSEAAQESHATPHTTTPTANALQRALLHVKQMLNLLDAHTAQSQLPIPQAGIHEGILYGMLDLLIPITSLMQMHGTSSQSLAAVIGAQANAPGAQPPDLATYLSHVSSILQMLEQIKGLLREPIDESSNDASALQVAEQEYSAAPLTPAQQRDLLLTLRRKRQCTKPLHSARACKEEIRSEECDSGICSSLYPIPSSLSFAPRSPWLAEVQASTSGETPAHRVRSLVQAFNSAMYVQCKAEAAALSSLNPDFGQNPPKHRIRARFVSREGTDAAEVQIELRDLGIVSLGLLILNDNARVMRITMCAPVEQRQGLRCGVSDSILPSKFAYYNQLSDHLFVYALHHHAKHPDYMEALGHTFNHIASLRTLFDPLPIFLAGVPSEPVRVALYTLDFEMTLDKSQCIVWKWCRVPTPPSDLVPSQQGEWCAYCPTLL
ncbi:hypothetical protein MVES_001096 [Malassezia vespertilionis]|uniref:Uncharacterized protein n=1 Tax=Malassezia vespertilionis TaxID=2020962 RepID=A0A2N1JDU0_9BASI|nr:hypothetical protein MVES_001096 [Malassezia vespertilionis]